MSGFGLTTCLSFSLSLCVCLLPSAWLCFDYRPVIIVSVCMCPTPLASSLIPIINADFLHLVLVYFTLFMPPNFFSMCHSMFTASDVYTLLA